MGKEKALPDNVRVIFTTNRDLYQKWSEWARTLGMSKSQFMNLSCTIGAKLLWRQVAPEDFITPELLKVIEQSGVAVSGIDKYLKEGGENE